MLVQRVSLYCKWCFVDRLPRASSHSIFPSSYTEIKCTCFIGTADWVSVCVFATIKYFMLLVSSKRDCRTGTPTIFIGKKVSKYFLVCNICNSTEWTMSHVEPLLCQAWQQLRASSQNFNLPFPTGLRVSGHFVNCMMLSEAVKIDLCDLSMRGEYL